MLEEKMDSLQEADGKTPTAVENQTDVRGVSVQETIDNSNAEENEDESVKDKHIIPMLDYDTLSMEQLTEELEKLVANEKVMAIKEHTEEIKNAFMSKFHEYLDVKREEFATENNEDTSGFEYHFPLKNKFDAIYEEFKNKRNKHYNQLQKNLDVNFEVRNQIIEELKNLIENGEDSIGDMFKKMNEIRERWKNAGAIPRDKYNIVWNNYHFHVERFYDLIHLDKQDRDIDFKNNLEQKQQLIVRAKDLLAEPDVMKAYRELQQLHRVWKEEIGPVDREHRETIWNEFSEITKQMHEKREALFLVAKEKEVANLAKKNEIIEEIVALGKEEITSHKGWQDQIVKMEALREKFFKIGKVPAENIDETWNKFKVTVREFNSIKNDFYKDIKTLQQENLNQKLALVAQANALKESEDFAQTTPIMKKIQEDWKKIGHVPRKYSETIWKDFREACNTYFDKVHAIKKEENQEEVEAFEKKKEFLENLKNFELVGEHKTDLDAIKKHIEEWKSLGKVPFNKRHIERKFNKILDALFEKLSLSKKDSEMMRFHNRMEQFVENEDQRALQNEQTFLSRKIEELKSDVLQLENNLQFVSGAKNNPFIKEVEKNILKYKEEQQILQEKLNLLRKL